MGKTGGKGISYFGLVAMGIGCMLGTSWLLLTGTWLETAGGPLNLVVAFALCIIIELPFAFAYMEAIPMLPLPGGEVVYSYAAFGSRGGFAVGWAGILMNTIVFCWVDLAAVSLLDELFPALGRTAVLYELGDFPVTLPNVAIQLALAGAILWVQLRGANVCASLAKLATVVLLIMCAVGLAVCFTHFDPAVYASDGGLDFDFAGSASLLSLLVFSVAGWETVGGQAGQFSVALIVRPGIFLPEGPPWTLDKYGSGTATDRHLGGSLHQLRHFVHMGQARLPLGHWLEHLLGVYHLGARTAVPGGQPIPLHLRTDGDDGDGGVVRLRQARNKLDGTAAGGGVAYSDTAADTGVGVRGKGGINLILHENMPDTVPLIQNSVVERQSLPAGHTKYRRHTIVGQQAGHYISSMLFHPLVHTFLI